MEGSMEVYTSGTKSKYDAKVLDNCTYTYHPEKSQSMVKSCGPR